MKAHIRMRVDRAGPVIQPDLYGHFAEHLGACVYGGIWVGPSSPIPNTRGIRNDVTEALRRLGVPVLRWPGGCFADEYHWRNGIGPRERRPKTINSHWGRVIETNAFGTHEFFDLCDQIGAAPYVCGNVGSGSVAEMGAWVEYITCEKPSTLAELRREHGREKPWQLPYFGVGNESWGCGGNMRPDYYADNYLRYNTAIKNHGRRVTRIACGANSEDYAWTEVMMGRVGKRMDALSLHYYTLPTGDWSRHGPATGFGESEWHQTLRRALCFEAIIARHVEIMDRHDPERAVGLVIDEWGTWYDAEPGQNPAFLRQENTLRDAIVAALHFNAFHRHAERVVMANVAQMINVLQAVVMTEGSAMLLTPTYHAFDLYRGHRGARRIELECDAPAYSTGGEAIPTLDATASIDDGGGVRLSVVNTHPSSSVDVVCDVVGAAPETASARELVAPEKDSHNSFDLPRVVEPRSVAAVRLSGTRLELGVPPRSITTIELR